MDMISPRSAVSSAMLVLGVLLAAAGCGERLRAPAGTQVGEPAGAPGTGARVTGCLELTISLIAQTGDITVAEGAAGCGTLQPVLAGAPVLDAERQQLRLPIALENRSTLPVAQPVYLLAPDTFRVLLPDDLADQQDAPAYLAYLSAGNPAVRERAASWRIDLASTRPLIAGGISDLHWIDIALHPAVQRFRLRLAARSGRAPTDVPELPVREVLTEVYARSNLVYEHPRSTGPYPSDLVVLLFREDASIADKRRVIERIGGEVVGGSPIGRGGFYYVRVVGDGTADALFEAMDLAASEPTVDLAGPDYLLSVQ
jgi:hypothetical protein